MSKISRNGSECCPECGSTTEKTNKFCNNCGYKLVITEEILDKHGHEIKVTQTVESEFPIDIPKGLTLLPKERLLSRHGDLYVSNMRILYHQPGFVKGKTQDWHLRHIKGTEERIEKPLMRIGLIVGGLLVAIGIFSGQTLIVVVGILLLVISVWYKTIYVAIQHMDGTEIVRIKKTDSKTGKHFIQTLRGQLYSKT